VRGAAVPLLTRPEVARRLGLSFSTIRRLGASGEITEIKLGKRAVRIDPASVEAFIRAGRRTPSQAA
jgi:excisionase family DNA binding protein